MQAARRQGAGTCSRRPAGGHRLTNDAGLAADGRGAVGEAAQKQGDQDGQGARVDRLQGRAGVMRHGKCQVQSKHKHFALQGNQCASMVTPIPALPTARLHEGGSRQLVHAVGHLGGVGDAADQGGDERLNVLVAHGRAALDQDLGGALLDLQGVDARQVIGLQVRRGSNKIRCARHQKIRASPAAQP